MKVLLEEIDKKPNDDKVILMKKILYLMMLTILLTACDTGNQIDIRLKNSLNPPMEKTDKEFYLPGDSIATNGVDHLVFGGFLDDNRLVVNNIVFKRGHGDNVTILNFTFKIGTVINIPTSKSAIKLKIIDFNSEQNSISFEEVK